MGLCYKVKSTGSNGEFELTIDHDKGENEAFITITGEFKGEPIQLDFNGLDSREFQELHDYVTLVNEKLNGK